MQIEKFHQKIGELMLSCQRIENDIKYMYAGMHIGDLAENFEKSKNLNFGDVLILLQELDNEDNNPYLSTDHYNSLNGIRRMRNYWAHKGYTDFIYEKNALRSKAYQKQCQRLLDDNNYLAQLSNIIEKVRLQMLRDYNRID